VRVAVDAMGGDHAPRELVAGAVSAAGDGNLSVVLVGRENEIEAELAGLGGKPDNVSIVHAADVIGMGESPVEALKRHPESSILKALSLLRTGGADGVVAAGSTGAAVAASMIALERLPGVRRPGIAVPLPAQNPRGIALLIDAGANPNCRPHHLFQYGVMGASYYREVLGEPNPRVALVSIGEEETKGNELTKEARKLLRESNLNFVGNVEGGHLFAGGCEVAVCDGFVGNIILKSAEGLAEMLLVMLAEEIGRKDPASLQAFARRVDYAEFGGAPLLGFNGLVTICHGRSDRRAIANAIRACGRAADHRLGDAIVRGLHPGRTEEEEGASVR